MNIRIDPHMKELDPHFRLGCLTFNAVVQEGCPALWDHFSATTLPQVQQRLARTPLVELDGIRQSREAYRAFGKSPSKFRISSDSLIRRLRQGLELYRVNTVVDVNNLISVETGLSMGTYDMASLQGQVSYTLGGPGETYEGIGKGDIDLCCMPILKDELGAFGSPTSDSRRTMVGPHTTRVLGVIHCFGDEFDLPAILERSTDYFVRFAGATNLETWIEEP